MDIGDIVSQEKFSREFCKPMQALTIAQKYILLKNHKLLCSLTKIMYFPHNTLVVVIVLLGMIVWLSVHPWLISMVYCDRWMVHSVLLVLFFVVILKYVKRLKQ